MRWSGFRAFMLMAAVWLRSGVAATAAGQSGVREVPASKRGVIPLQTRRPVHLREVDATELPALYELKDGKLAIVNFQIRDGIYIVPKVLDRGYLALSQRVEFWRTSLRTTGWGTR